jgi:proteasome alpha subunit
VAEVGASQDLDHLYRLTFDGSIADEHNFIVMGGQADKVSEAVAAGWQGELDFAGAIRLDLAGLVADKDTTTLPASALEVAVLDRGSESGRGTRRAFRRLEDPDIVALLAEEK